MEPNSVRKQRKKRSKSLFSLNFLIKRNPSILLGISLPFVITTAISLKAVVAITLEMLIINLTAALVIACTAKITALWPRVLISVGTSTGVMILVRFLIRGLFPETFNHLGAYIYLMGLNSIMLLLSAPLAREASRSLFLLLRRVVFHTFAFGILMFLVALPREYMGNGTLWEQPIPIVFRLPGVLLPFFGFIAAGLVLAAVKFLSKKLAYWRGIENARKQARDEERYTKIHVDL